PDGNHQLQMRVLVSDLRQSFEIHEIEFRISNDHFAIIDVAILCGNSRVFTGSCSAAELLPAKISKGVVNMCDLRYINILRVEIAPRRTSRPGGVISSIIIVAARYYFDFLTLRRGP